MRVKDQLLAHFQRLQRHNQELARTIEKYRQETEYACLKTGLPDWPAFLAAVRTGRVAPVGRTDGRAGKEQTEGAAMALLNGLFENASTSRSTARAAFCECESPVGSEGSVHHPKGGDTSRSESVEQPPPMPDPFKQLRLQETQGARRGGQEESIEQILRYIEHYEHQKAQPMQGFDTFRKPEKEDALNETAANADSTDKSRGLSSGRQPSAFQQTSKVEHAFKPFWRHKENVGSEVHEWKSSPSANEYTLAVQNTKLRKQLREFQSRLLL